MIGDVVVRVPGDAALDVDARVGMGSAIGIGEAFSLLGDVTVRQN